MFTAHSVLFVKPFWIRWEWGVWELHAENGGRKQLTRSTCPCWHDTKNIQLTFAASCDSATWEGSPFTYWIRMHATGSSNTPSCCVLQNWMGDSVFLKPQRKLTYFTINSLCFSSHLKKSQVAFLKTRYFLIRGRVSDIWAPGSNSCPVWIIASFTNMLSGWSQFISHH